MQEVGLIIRPDDLEIADVNIAFNFLNYTKLEIDLAHVNKDRRSSYSSIEVAWIASHLLDDLRLKASDEKSFGEEVCSYFVRSGEFEGKKYKLVFCICSDRPESIGVITLHRVK